MGSDDDMFRIWSGPEGSSHKEPLSGIRIHRAHGVFYFAGWFSFSVFAYRGIYRLLTFLHHGGPIMMHGIAGGIVGEAFCRRVYAKDWVA